MSASRALQPAIAEADGGNDLRLAPPGLGAAWVFAAAFRQRRLIFVTLASTLLLVGAGVLLLPDSYESRMKILVKNARVDVVVTPEKTGGALGSGEVSEAQINSEIELLSGRDLLEQVARDCGLAAGAGRGAAPAEFENAVRRLQKDLKIAPVKKSNVIEVTYSAKSPELAASVLRRLSELYLDKHLRLHRTPGTYDFFTAQAEQYKSELGAAEARLTDFQQKTGLISVEQQKEIYLRKYADAKSQLGDAEASVAETRGRIARIQDQLAATDRRVLTQSRKLPNQYSVERLNTMLVELQNRRTQLLTKFQPDDRLVREADDQIANTRAALDKAAGTTSVEEATDLNPLRQSLESELTKARLEEVTHGAARDNLAAQVAEYGQMLSRLESGVNVQADLLRQVKSAEESYQLYAKKQEEARITEELDRQKISNVSIAEAPSASPLPAKLGRGLALALGLVLALMLGAGAAVLAEFLRDDVQTAAELEAACRGNVLATVPLMPVRPAAVAGRHELTPVGDLKSIEAVA